MAICPECKNEMEDSAQRCPHCGKLVIEGDKIEHVPTKITTGQKIFIAVSIIILIAIGLTYQNVSNREDLASQHLFSEPFRNIMRAAVEHSGLGRQFGVPTYSLDAKPKSAEASIVFPSGSIGQENASIFARAVCIALARTYVDKGYMPRSIIVKISSRQPMEIDYGTAVYDGNHDTLAWKPAQ